MKKVKNNNQDNYNKAFPSLLRSLLEKYNITQKELGASIGVTRQSISKYQDGTTTPDIYIFKKIVDFFNEKCNLNYSYEYWLGSISLERDIEDMPFSLSTETIGLSQEAFGTLITFSQRSEMNAISEVLENVELIQFLQDYLGDEIRNDKYHLSFEGTKETLENLFSLSNYLDFNFSIDDLYDELKIKSIVKELKKMRKQKGSRIKQSFTE